MSRSPGRPYIINSYATTQQSKFKLPAGLGHISIRNVGGESIFFSFDGEQWFDVASGTSYDEDIEVVYLYAKTRNSYSGFVVNGVVWT